MMKLKMLALAVLLMSGILPAKAIADDAESANHYLPACRALAGDREILEKDSFEIGQCLGIIKAAIFYGTHVSDYPACVPQITLRQAAAVIVRWLDQHPKNWGADLHLLAMVALHDTWPCHD